MCFTISVMGVEGFFWITFSFLKSKLWNKSWPFERRQIIFFFSFHWCGQLQEFSISKIVFILGLCRGFKLQTLPIKLQLESFWNLNKSLFYLCLSYFMQLRLTFICKLGSNTNGSQGIWGRWCEYFFYAILQKLLFYTFKFMFIHAVF